MTDDDFIAICSLNVKGPIARLTAYDVAMEIMVHEALDMEWKL